MALSAVLNDENGQPSENTPANLFDFMNMALIVEQVLLEGYGEKPEADIRFLTSLVEAGGIIDATLHARYLLEREENLVLSAQNLMPCELLNSLLPEDTGLDQNDLSIILLKAMMVDDQYNPYSVWRMIGVLECRLEILDAVDAVMRANVTESGIGRMAIHFSDDSLDQAFQNKLKSI